MAYAKDLTGQKFGRLTVISRNHEKQKEMLDKNKGNKAYWNCKCDCGNKNVIVVSSSNLTNKTSPTISCGCYKNEAMHKQKNTKTIQWEFNDNVAIGITNKGDKFYIDKEDYDKVKDYCWRVNKSGYIVANARNGTNKTIWIHRVLMNIEDINVLIDHKDWNKANNKKSNLRVATKSENNINIKRKSNNTTGYTGVSLNKRTGNYIARISINGKRIYLGTFSTFKEAVNARHIAEDKIHGEWSGEFNRKDFIRLLVNEAEELINE